MTIMDSSTDDVEAGGVEVDLNSSSVKDTPDDSEMFFIDTAVPDEDTWSESQGEDAVSSQFEKEVSFTAYNQHSF